ncbi:MAG: hypothetical protein IKN73_01615 [Alphaproteobacteria bacterium]|nr:hypothetical protein [Alphaproteobacteria bacterium]
MKKTSLSLISLFSVLTCASANAGVIADFYIGGMVGAGGHTLFTKDSHESAPSRLIGAVAGVDIPVVRAELEYNYLDSSELSTNAAMLNIYAKMPSTLIMPYIGAGFGMVFGGEHKYDEKGTEYKFDIDSTTAYQAMLGATVDILAVPLKFDIEGRALYAPDIYKISGTSTTPDLLEYNVRVKMRYIF